MNTQLNTQPTLNPSPKKKGLPLPAKIAIIAVAAAIVGVAVFFIARRFGTKIEQAVTEITDKDAGWNAPDYVTYKPIIKNEFSRPGTALEKINGVVVHYVGNPGTTAEQNRNYFNGLAESGAAWASSHFLIGLDGEVLQIIPLDEIAYCSNNRNSDTVSIECCHPDEDGKFTEETYDSLVRLLADLCREYNLDPGTDVIRHYDVTGKLCPLYFVEHEDEWEDLRREVAELVGAEVTE